MSQRLGTGFCCQVAEWGSRNSLFTANRAVNVEALQQEPLNYSNKTASEIQELFNKMTQSSYVPLREDPSIIWTTFDLLFHSGMVSSEDPSSFRLRQIMHAFTRALQHPLQHDFKIMETQINAGGVPTRTDVGAFKRLGTEYKKTKNLGLFQALRQISSPQVREVALNGDKYLLGTLVLSNHGLGMLLAAVYGYEDLIFYCGSSEGPVIDRLKGDDLQKVFYAAVEKGLRETVGHLMNKASEQIKMEVLDLMVYHGHVDLFNEMFRVHSTKMSSETIKKIIVCACSSIEWDILASLISTLQVDEDFLEDMLCRAALKGNDSVVKGVLGRGLISGRTIAAAAGSAISGKQFKIFKIFIPRIASLEEQWRDTVLVAAFESTYMGDVQFVEEICRMQGINGDTLKSALSQMFNSLDTRKYSTVAKALEESSLSESVKEMARGFGKINKI